MSIYLAAMSPKEATNPLFKQRGLLTHTDAELQTLQIRGISNARMIAYDGYKSNIDIFIAATNRQMKLGTSIEGALLSNATRPLLPIDHPAVAFMMGTKLSEDEQVAFLGKTAAFEPERKTIGKTTAFIMHKPTAALYDKLILIASEKPAHIPGTVNLHANGAFLQLLRVVTEFIATNTYPAHYQREQEHEDNLMQTTAGEISLTYTMIERCSRSRSPAPSTLTVPGEGTSAMAVDDAPPKKPSMTVKFGAAASAVFVAKPSPVPATFNYGPVSAIPFFAGRAFPYFHRMIRPSALFMKTTFSDYFFRTLGDSRSEQYKQLKAMKSGIDALAGSASGMVLAHLLYGIRLALETQTRLFVVIDRSYCGFVLIGERWSIFDGKQWLQPESDEELNLTVADMSSHRAAIAQLAAKLSTMSIKAELPKVVKRPVAISDITSGMALLKLISSRVLNDDDKEAMARPLGMVTFAKAYKAITPENLVWALEHMTIKDDVPLPEDLNVYIAPSLNNIEDRVYQVLASFGSDAPSFRNATGSIFSIPPLSSSKDPNEEVDPVTHKKALSHMLIGPKAIQVAYGDMKRVLKEKTIQMDLKERAGGSRSIALYGERRDVVYRALKECVGRAAEPVGEGKGKKRKADDEEEGVRRVKPTTARDVLDLF